MFDILAQGLPELAGAVTSGAQPLMDGAGIQFNPPTNQQADGVSTLFNILETGIRLLIGVGVLLAVGFCIKGGVDLMRAGGSPQMMEKARNQIIFSVMGGVVVVGSFFFVGTVIDFFSGASGGRIQEFGEIDAVAAKPKVGVNAFLAVYGGQAVACPSTVGNGNAKADVPGTEAIGVNGETGTPEWEWHPATGGNTAYCQKK